MSAKSIYENQGKNLLFRTLTNKNFCKQNILLIDGNLDNLDSLLAEHTFLNDKIVCKPDQLIKRRGKLGLVKLGDWNETKVWLKSKMNTNFSIGECCGKLNRFVIEPFIQHDQEHEHYLCIYSERNCDVILFYKEGGIDIGNVDEKANKVEISIDVSELTGGMIKSLLVDLEPAKHSVLSEFIINLYSVYKSQYFTYLEVNPLVIKMNEETKDYNIYLLDLAAKIDQTAEYICKNSWGDLEFPPGFGRDAYLEELYIQELDSKSGASMKLTVINPKGRIWTMVAGGGASVVYADTICDYGQKDELANYGEYSGAPTEQQTYEYAKTILSLMTKYRHNDGKVLLIGGGIANFTNVAATLKGVVKALKEYKNLLKEHSVSIFVRRAGPNYQEGLKIMRELGNYLDIPVEVYGPETHMTAIVSMALNKSKNLKRVSSLDRSFEIKEKRFKESKGCISSLKSNASDLKPEIFTFNNTTTSIVWGLQIRAIQSMLDFDFVCRRTTPSVSAIVYPMTNDHSQKFYFGQKEIMIPAYKHMYKCIEAHPDVSVLINFASLRSAYESTIEVLNDFPQIRCISVIAEGIPENLTRKMNKLAKEKNVVVIGPATVGGIKPGCFKIGNTGGMMDNIISSKLYRPGSVAYVSKSGGMSNELNNMISLNADGVFDGVAIGGDRYPGTLFIDFIMKYQYEDRVKMIVILGEVGGKDEYEVVKAIKNGEITKPIIAWCIGTCASYFTTNVQFGHAGSCANTDEETAMAKNKAFKEAGAIVPDSFDALGSKISEVYLNLVARGIIIKKAEVTPPTVPMDYSLARELGIVRKPTSFMTSICDERGSELLYAGVPISSVIEQAMGIGGVLSLLWFQKRLPIYCEKFLELCFMITANHISENFGVQNTILCAQAGKDLISSLTSGLLAISSLDSVVKCVSKAYDSGISSTEFVKNNIKDGQLIKENGHRKEPKRNPSLPNNNNEKQHLESLKSYVLKHFPKISILEYVMEVEKISGLTLTLNELISISLVDMLRNCGSFTLEDVNKIVEIETLNAIFVMGRSLDFIGQYLNENLTESTLKESSNANININKIMEQHFSIGDVLCHSWFQKQLPAYFGNFIEMCLILVADHGPAVSGAHNTIVCTRAKKDLISSLTSGLLTIGDRFGGAIDAAAKQFSNAFDSSMSPMDFVNQTRKDGKLIMGIGHRVKSINNPDQRVEILKKYIFRNFPKTSLVDYALAVEKITTSKKPNLILNVDGLIGVAMVDLLRNCGEFTLDQATEFVDIGALNALFVLGRSIGFIGHFLDQKRLNQGLYRHPWDDISYVLPEKNNF